MSCTHVQPKVGVIGACNLKTQRPYKQKIINLQHLLLSLPRHSHGNSYLHFYTDFHFHIADDTKTATASFLGFSTCVERNLDGERRRMLKEVGGTC